MLTTISYTFYAFVFYLSVVKKTPKKVLGFKSTIQSQEYATLNDSNLVNGTCIFPKQNCISKSYEFQELHFLCHLRP
jgi:hypothetical protein